MLPPAEVDYFPDDLRLLLLLAERVFLTFFYLLLLYFMMVELFRWFWSSLVFSEMRNTVWGLVF